MSTEVRMTLRLPLWAAQFLDRMGEENLTSRNAEIIRSVKERMEGANGASSRTDWTNMIDHQTNEEGTTDE